MKQLIICHISWVMQTLFCDAAVVKSTVMYPHRSVYATNSIHGYLSLSTVLDNVQQRTDSLDQSYMASPIPSFISVYYFLRDKYKACACMRVL